MQVLQRRVVPIASLPGLVLYASCGKRGRDYARQQKLKLVAHINPAEFHTVIRQAWGTMLVRSAPCGTAVAIHNFLPEPVSLPVRRWR